MADLLHFIQAGGVPLCNDRLAPFLELHQIIDHRSAEEARPARHRQFADGRRCSLALLRFIAPYLHFNRHMRFFQAKTGEFVILIEI